MRDRRRAGPGLWTSAGLPHQRGPPGPGPGRTTHGRGRQTASGPCADVGTRTPTARNSMSCNVLRTSQRCARYWVGCWCRHIRVPTSARNRSKPWPDDARPGAPDGVRTRRCSQYQYYDCQELLASQGFSHPNDAQQCAGQSSGAGLSRTPHQRVPPAPGLDRDAPSGPPDGDRTTRYRQYQ